VNNSLPILSGGQHDVHGEHQTGGDPNMSFLKKLLVVTVALGAYVGLMTLFPPEKEEVAAEPEKVRPKMSEEELATFLSMDPIQTRRYINADGESCPLVTNRLFTIFPDTKNPVWIVSCSDGSRYYVFWSGSLRVLDAP
jgi:hypothetical protein